MGQIHLFTAHRTCGKANTFHSTIKKGAVVVDKNTAWDSFKHTGNIRDYLIYSQLRQRDEEKQLQEDQDEDGRRRLGYHGEMRG